MINGLFNSFRVYQKLNPQSNIRYKDFLFELARNWLSPEETKESSDLEKSVPGPSNIVTRTRCKDHPQKLSGSIKQHIPIQIPPSKNKKFPTRCCKVCTTNGKRSETRYVCKLCGVPLHLVTCFTKYHTLKKF